MPRARSGRKRKSTGFNPATGHKPVNEVPVVTDLGSPDLMVKRAAMVGVDLVCVSGAYQAKWLEHTGKTCRKAAVTLDLHTTDKRIAQQRLGMVPRIKAFDGSLLHAWLFTNRIGRNEYEAGRKFDALAKRYRALICAPNPDEGPGVKRAPGIDDPEAFAKVKDKYEAAFEALNGRNNQRAVADLLRNAEPRVFAHARAGLNLLARHWGL